MSSLVCVVFILIKRMLTFTLGVNKSQSYFLSSKLMSTCEQWYWRKYTDILYTRRANLTYERSTYLRFYFIFPCTIRTVKRNPCPCSYDQAESDFRFYRMNSENRLERASNIVCFVPLGAFAQRTSGATIYQQVSMGELNLFSFQCDDHLDMLLS